MTAALLVLRLPGYEASPRVVAPALAIDRNVLGATVAIVTAFLLVGAAETLSGRARSS